MRFAAKWTLSLKPRQDADDAVRLRLPRAGSVQREFVSGSKLESRPELPGRELFISDTGQFAFGFLSTGNGYDLFEDSSANLFHRLGSIKDGACVDVHVLLHPLVERCVGR